jgi:sulfatase maturation enzyme AslB (radical SAM superfamily)
VKPPPRHRNITVRRLLLDAVQFIRCQSGVVRRLGKPFRPSRRYAEIDITYKCNLNCVNCNRSCTQAPSDLELPVAAVEAFLAQSAAQQIAWQRIRVLGGEPTLHSRFFDIIDLLTAYRQTHNPAVRLVVCTNFHGAKVRRVLEQLPPSIVIKSTLKTSRTNLFRPFNVAPADRRLLNRFSDYTCGCRIIEECGLGVTPSGYYMCAVAGGIDRVFGCHLGRPTLPDPYDTFEDQMAAFCPLCGHFGFQWPTRKPRQSRTWRLAYAAARQARKPL